MILPDYTTGIQLLIFLTTVLILGRFLFIPMLGLFEERYNATRGAVREAEKTKEEADSLEAKYKAEIDGAWNKAFMEKERIVKEGEEQARAVLDKAREESQAEIERLRAGLQQEVASVRETLRQGLSETARQMGSRILGRTLQALCVALLLSGKSWAEGSGHEGGEGLLTLNLLWSAINFCIFLGILVRYLKAPVRDFLKERKTAIATTIEEAAALKKKEEERHRLFSDKCAGIQRDIREIQNSLRKEGEEEKKKLLDEAGGMGLRLREEAKEIAEAETVRARRVLREEAAALAAGLAEKIVREKLTDEDHRRLSGEFLSRLKGSF